MNWQELVVRYWNPTEVGINALVFAHIFGALLLGLVAGYERTYHGRAAGMRTYGLVCMASCALTVLVAFPQHWFGGSLREWWGSSLPPDPTRIIQGIVTGIGFLGAGMIMKDGLSISGLTSAASLWASSAIGVLVGIGFYSAAILLTLLSASLMMWASRLERLLPQHPAICLTLTFATGFQPDRAKIDALFAQRGCRVANGSFSVRFDSGRHAWRFVAVEVDRRRVCSMTQLSHDLSDLEGLEAFEIGHARN